MPKAAIISSRTTGIRDAIEGAGLVGGMALTLALMYEIALGSKSPWAGYIAIMPSHEPTLLYWSEEELAEVRALPPPRLTRAAPKGPGMHKGCHILEPFALTSSPSPPSEGPMPVLWSSFAS